MELVACALARAPLPRGSSAGSRSDGVVPSAPRSVAAAPPPTVVRHVLLGMTRAVGVGASVDSAAAGMLVPYRGGERARWSLTCGAGVCVCGERRGSAREEAHVWCMMSLWRQRQAWGGEVMTDMCG